MFVINMQIYFFQVSSLYLVQSVHFEIAERRQQSTNITRLQNCENYDLIKGPYL